MKAYWIAYVDVKNHQEYEGYLKLAPAALQAYGATILARGDSDSFTTLEGFDEEPSRAVVIEFESYEKALACYHSEAYQEACLHRKEAASAKIIIMKSLAH